MTYLNGLKLIDAGKSLFHSENEFDWIVRQKLCPHS